MQDSAGPLRAQEDSMRETIKNLHVSASSQPTFDLKFVSYDLIITMAKMLPTSLMSTNSYLMSRGL